MVTEKQPQGGVNLPSGGDSDAWPFPRPAWRVVREGRAPRRRSWLGGEVGLQLTNPQREGWGRGRDRRKSVKLEPRGGKSAKAFKKPPGGRNWKRTQGLSGLGLTLGSHSLAHPARVWGLRGPEGRAPRTGHLTWHPGAEPRSCKSRERWRATFSLLNAPFPLYLRRWHSSRGPRKFGSTWPGGAVSRPVASYKVKLRRLLHMRRAAVTACPSCSCSPRPGNEPVGGSRLGPVPRATAQPAQLRLDAYKS